MKVQYNRVKRISKLRDRRNDLNPRPGKSEGKEIKLRKSGINLLDNFCMDTRHSKPLRPDGLFFNVIGLFCKEVVATRLLAAALRSICSENRYAK